MKNPIGEPSYFKGHFFRGLFNNHASPHVFSRSARNAHLVSPQSKKKLHRFFFEEQKIGQEKPCEFFQGIKVLNLLFGFLPHSLPAEK